MLHHGNREPETRFAEWCASFRWESLRCEASFSQLRAIGVEFPGINRLRRCDEDPWSTESKECPVNSCYKENDEGLQRASDPILNNV
mmetsp:Transcript_29495/g.94590  ORF Transcript_29495/g.94590 Transcript_29495/m.94590 type:complete len:87 (-) Transcript_29495:1039-1299(-)